jgi:hypothetical protein
MTQVVEETPRERTKRWQDIASKKADELQPKEAICSRKG